MIRKILDNDICTGCGLCHGIFGPRKVTVELNNEGFYRPQIHAELDKEEEKLFLKICPGINVRKESNNAVYNDPIWGEMYSCFIGAANDDKIRCEASSGGAISAILVYLLETKMVSAVIHIGSSIKSPIGNEVKISTTREEVIANANSRYSPSAPLIDILNNIKDYDSYVFVGKPCDVAGLRQLSNFRHDVKNKIKYYISFFCAGVPSLNATKDIARAMDINLNDISTLEYRKDGWPGYFKIVDKHNNQHKLSYSLTWMKLLGPEIQFRCKICADGVGHLSDIVCADAWEDFDNKGFPTFKNAPGQSLIISRTSQGDELISKVLASHYIDKTRTVDDFREIDKIQPGQLSKKITFVSRLCALKLKNRITPNFNKEFYINAFIRQRFLDFIRNFLGTLKRIQ